MAALRLLPRRRRTRILLGIPLLLLASMPFSWYVWPAKITYARFGVTVYGFLPVPAADLVIHANGLPWYRTKSHRVMRAEIERLVEGEDVTDVIVGTGWEGMVRVEPEARANPGVNVHVLRTGEAIEFYNLMRAAGKRVVLILHSTC